MSRKTEAPTRNVLRRIRPFVGAFQLKAIEAFCRGEEGDWYARKVQELAEIIERMPLPYTTDGQGDDAIVHLHYFTSGWDFYILEKDSEPEQTQAFGLVAGIETELGYVSIDEITRTGAEIDLHWVPKPLRDVRETLTHR